MDDLPRCRCRLIALDEINECLQWALSRYSIERASWIVRRLTDHVQQGGASSILASVVEEVGSEVETGSSSVLDRQRMSGAAIAIRQPAGAATLLALQSMSPEGACQVVQPLIDRLSALGTTFIQAGCDDDEQGQLLQAAGFQPLAEMMLMSLEADRFPPAPSITPPLKSSETSGESVDAANESASWVKIDQLGNPLGGEGRQIFCDVAINTFIETRDCARLGEFRTPEDIIRGYLESPTFNPAMAGLLKVQGRWAGCLILSPHGNGEVPGNGEVITSESPHFKGSIELAYMGLVPAFRGRGLGRVLLAETIAASRAAGANRIVLAVDRENHPAAAIYRGMGWEEVLSESVWGCKI